MYEVDNNGVIRSPGKFEGEMLYVPYFWEMVMNGFSSPSYDEDNCLYNELDITKEDREKFPELDRDDEKATTIELYEDLQGFVYGELQK